MMVVATRRFRAAALGTALLLLAAVPAPAAVPADPAARAALIGSPVGLTVQPAAVTLAGPRAVQQVVVTGRYADGTVRDLTAVCELSLENPAFAKLEAGGFLTPVKDGATALVVKAATGTAGVPVTVKDLTKPSPISFRNQVVASLNVGGCNMG